MPNRQLSADELVLANQLLSVVRSELETLSRGDSDLLFAFRRKIAKELGYDERSKPMVRKALKKRMRVLQKGICPGCQNELPETYCVLDRFNAADGYVEGNVRLICETCDRETQRLRGFS